MKISPRIALLVLLEFMKVEIRHKSSFVSLLLQLNGYFIALSALSTFQYKTWSKFNNLKRGGIGCTDCVKLNFVLFP